MIERQKSRWREGGGGGLGVYSEQGRGWLAGCGGGGW